MHSPADQPGERAAFDFYHGYLAVIYGLVATDGLEHVTAFPGEAKWSFLVIVLFFGTFLVSLHFWFVCATVDELSHVFYWALAGRKRAWFELLLLFDALAATAFAGFVIAMFQSISGKHVRFFLLFLVAAGVSLLYDLYSYLLISRARRRQQEVRDQAIIERYGKKVTRWLKQDLIFVLTAAATYLLYSTIGVRSSVASGIIFIGSAILLLLLDVGLFLIVDA